MKCMRNFKLDLRTPAPNSSEEFLTNERKLGSWHCLWKAVDEFLASAADGSEAIVTKPNTMVVIAKFCASDLEGDHQEEGRHPRWESSRFGIYQHCDYSVNRNISDFHWLLLDGAVHDVPYELSFFERQASYKPDGLVAYGMGLIAELRDLRS